MKNYRRVEGDVTENEQFSIVDEDTNTVVYEVTRRKDDNRHWEVRRPGSEAVLDVDKYSNDIMERAGCGIYDRQQEEL